MKGWIGIGLIVMGLSCPETGYAAIVPSVRGETPEPLMRETIEEGFGSEADDLEADDSVEPRPYAPLRSPTACPSDLETMTALLMRDIPHYTNRVLQRTVAALPGNDADGREPYRPSYVLIAGRPELTPLDLQAYAFTRDPAAGGPLSQLFFTTLSRQYAGLRVSEVQEYHWLFLTQATDGWWLGLMFSTIDGEGLGRSPLPPFESSDSSVGQAVQLWLRDCRAGAIAPWESEE